MAGNGVNQSTWTPGFKATLTTDATYTVSYTCYSTLDGSQIGSGTFEDVVGTIVAPTISKYVFDHATDADDNAFAMTTEITEDISLKFYYNPLLTYRFMFNETEVGTEDVAFTAGGAYPTPTKVPYGFSYTLPTGNVAASMVGTTVDIALTWIVFSYASSFDNITQWYLVRLHSNQTHYMYNNGGTVSFADAVDNSGVDAENSFLWAFVGDPLTGFQMYNYTAGQEVAIDNSVPCGLSAEGKNVNFTVYSSAAGTYGASAAAYFALYAEANNYLNYQGGNIKRWADNDEGSTFMIDEAIPATDTKLFDEILAQLEAFTYGKGLGEYSLTGEFAEYAGNEANIIANLKDGGYSKEALAKAQALLDATVINQPTGKFIRLKNTVVSGYSYVGTAASDKAPLVADAEDAGIYYVTEDNKVVSYNQGLCLGTDAGAQCVAPESAAEFTIGDGGAGTYTFAYGGLGYLIAWTSGYTDRLSSVSDHARFTVEEVTELPVAVTDAGYATLYAPVALTIPTNVEAYTGEVSGNALKLTALEGKIPAATAVVLKATAGDYNFTTTTADAFAGTNDLKGTVGGKATSSDVLTLQQKDAVGFYTYTGETLAGFKAYLDVPAEVKGLTLQFGEETAISRIEAQTGNGAVYNLAGQRVVKAQKGLYIMGGKKVVVK